MSRPTAIRDEDILAAAREVFLERGVEGTTSEVAKRAGVSEGSIFNRFKTKDDLFRAAMSTHLDASPWMTDLEARVGKGELAEQLVEIGLQAVQFFRRIVPMAMMNWANKKACLAVEHGFEPPPVRALKRMAGYFEAEMRRGRLHRHDAEIVARTFVGGIVSFVFVETMWDTQATLPMPAETYVRGHVKLLLSGLQADKAAAPRTHTKK